MISDLRLGNWDIFTVFLCILRDRIVFVLVKFAACHLGPCSQAKTDHFLFSLLWKGMSVRLGELRLTLVTGRLFYLL
jgi:hypothetical protein